MEVAVGELVCRGVGLNQGVEVADAREVAGGGGISVAVAGMRVGVAAVGVVGSQVSALAASATFSPGRSTVRETGGSGTVPSMEGTTVVPTAGAQADTRTT